jgi:hypothetical protein
MLSWLWISNPCILFLKIIMKGGTNIQGFFVQTAHRILLLLPVPSLLLQRDDQLFFKPKRCHIFFKNCKLFSK